LARAGATAREWLGALQRAENSFFWEAAALMMFESIIGYFTLTVAAAAGNSQNSSML
jgi:hypothetical protein